MKKKKKKDWKFKKNADSAVKGGYTPNSMWIQEEDESESYDNLIKNSDKEKDDYSYALASIIDSNRRKFSYNFEEDGFDSRNFLTEEDQLTDPDFSTFISKDFGRAILFPSKIKSWLTEEQLKLLYITSARVDITDNIQKCDMVRYILGDGFREIGAGTNRIAFQKANKVLKVSLDPRGIVDNITELCRSLDYPQFLAKTYESNAMVNIQEYCTVCSKDDIHDPEFKLRLKKMLEIMSQTHLFDDLCIDSDKNYTNFGYRTLYDSKGKMFKQPVIVDYGYFYDITRNRDFMRCSRCGEILYPSSGYSYLICKNKHRIQVSDKRNEMSREYEKREIENIYRITNVKLPTMDEFASFFYKSSLSKEMKERTINAVMNTFKSNKLEDFLGGR